MVEIPILEMTFGQMDLSVLLNLFEEKGDMLSLGPRQSSETDYILTAIILRNMSLQMV